MSLLNKYMHPRNIYRTPPNFKELAILYPDFRTFVKQDISGKVSIDFKDQATLRALTTTLLKKDFNLNIDLPLDRLVPTLPLRLNYLLWIEDLVVFLKIEKSENVCGIDVGTGAAAIYSLLAAKLHSWKMLATEVDVKNFEISIDNIKMNGLQDLITVQQVSAGQILSGVLNEETNYDFCMCNPPFFGTEQELEPSVKSRSKTRPAPHNAQTGAIHEMVVEGGEVAFISQMIQESTTLQTKIRIYTTMVGQKSSLDPLKAELLKAGVQQTAQTEFCQGHTTRWGLAWTFQNDITLKKSLPQPVSRKKGKKKVPLKYVVPSTCDLPTYSVTSVAKRVEELLLELNLTCEEVKNDKHESLYCATAFANTWSNQRRKRREESNNQIVETKDVPSATNNSTKCLENCSTDTSLKRKLDQLDSISDVNQKKTKMSDDSTTVPIPVNDPHQLGNPILKSHILIRKVSSEINILMSWLEGSLGRDAVHQLLQYIKNKLK